MSRRTKLIILAVFLVLLAIPTVYVVISWHPPNPLRFRLKSIAAPEGKNELGFPQFSIVQVSIKNRSSFPMRFYGARGTAPPGQASMRDAPPLNIFAEDMRGRLNALHSAQRQTLIPANSEIEVTGLLGFELRDPIQEGSIFVYGAWQSSTRDLATNAVSWIRANSPQWAQDIIPPLPGIIEVVPLEAAKQMPRLPSAPTGP